MSRKPTSNALQPWSQRARERQAAEEAEAKAKVRRPKRTRVRVEQPTDDLRMTETLNTAERQIVRGYRLSNPATRDAELRALEVEIVEERRR